MKEPRLIDAFSLSDEVFESKKDNPHSDGIIRRTHDHEHDRFLCMIALAPTVDAVPVVRCEDCTYCDPENCHCDHPMGTVVPVPRKPDDFCSYGERRDDNG